MNSSRNDIMYKILSSSQSVFPLRKVALMTNDSNVQSLSSRMNYCVRTGKLLNPRKGIYAKENYNPEELACAIYTPSYISLSYVLQRAGVVFQYDESITMISYLNRQLVVDGNQYQYRRIKGEILSNVRGITFDGCVSVATPERAFLDMLYLNSKYSFDNVSVLDREKIEHLLPIYDSRTIERRVAKIFSSDGYK